MNKYLKIIYANYSKSNFPKKLVAYLVSKYLTKSGTLLDVCCGTGEYCKLFQKAKIRAFGIDKFDRNLNLLQTYKSCDLLKEPIPFYNNSFDYVFAKSAIEHFADTDRFLSEIYRVMKKGSRLIILTPSWEHNYKEFFNDYTHVKPFHRKGLQDALKINGFKNVNVSYFYYLPFMWKFPFLLPFVQLVSLFNKFKWKDKEETVHRPFIRFCHEVQLLAIAEK